MVCGICVLHCLTNLSTEMINLNLIQQWEHLAINVQTNCIILSRPVQVHNVKVWGVFQAYT